jgi:alpha-beta hydrolase superfamily lysophospholipase
MTEFADIKGGRIAYDVTGQGPLAVLSHGIGDHRQVYRFLAPRLAQAGYRVAAADLRGHGESSMGWKSVTGLVAGTRPHPAAGPGVGGISRRDPYRGRHL